MCTNHIRKRMVGTRNKNRTKRVRILVRRTKKIRTSVKRKNTVMRGGEPRQVNMVIGMVQAATYDPDLCDHASPAARDGMRINHLIRQTGLPVVSIDTNYRMPVTDMHLSANTDSGHRLCKTLQQKQWFGDIQIDDIQIKDIFVDYHRFPSAYFQQFLRPFLGECGGLVGCLYSYQRVGGCVYIANLGDAEIMVKKEHITSRYTVSYVDANENPLSQATSAIHVLREQNQTELDKITKSFKFILLTKTDGSSSSGSSSSSSSSSSSTETPRKRRKT